MDRPELLRLDPLVLQGTHVRLEPLTLGHVEALWAVGRDSKIWQWSPAPVTTRAAMQAYVEAALEGQRQGHMLPFATMALPDEQVVGSTRFGNIVRAHRRVEIGWTWIAPPWQRTAVNTEAKWLMLRHAFEAWDCVRVELKTDRLNARSRAAIVRLGAQEEGTLRKHVVTASGRLRDTVYYSITDDEWPAVRAQLEARLAVRSPSTSRKGDP